MGEKNRRRKRKPCDVDEIRLRPTSTSGLIGIPKFYYYKISFNFRLNKEQEVSQPERVDQIKESKDKLV